MAEYRAQVLLNGDSRWPMRLSFEAPSHEVAEEKMLSISTAKSMENVKECVLYMMIDKTHMVEVLAKDSRQKGSCLIPPVLDKEKLEMQEEQVYTNYTLELK